MSDGDGDGHESSHERRDGSYASGIARLAALGEDRIDAFRAEFDDEAPGLTDWMVSACFGMIGSRPGLTVRERELITIALLTGLGQLPQVLSHTRIALAEGVTAHEIREAIIQTIPFAGMPGALNALRAVRPLLA